MSTTFSRAAMCLATLLAVAACSPQQESLLQRLAAITGDGDDREAFSASADLDQDGTWGEVSVGLAEPDRAALYSQGVGAGVERLILDAGERVVLDIASIEEDHVRELLDEVECAGSKSWTIRPTLTDATLEFAGCAAQEHTIALLGGEPIATGPDLLDEDGIRSLWKEASTALGSDVATQVVISRDTRRLYLANLHGGCPVSGGVLYTRQLAGGSEPPIRLDCLDTAAFRQENPGLDEGGVSVDDIVACLPELGESGLSVTAGGCS